MLRSPSPSSRPPKLEIFWHTKPLADADTINYTDDKENAYPHSTLDWDFGPLATTKEPEETKPVADPPPQSKRLSFQSSPPVRRRTTTTSKKREPLRPIQPRRSLKRNSTVSRSKRYSIRSFMSTSRLLLLQLRNLLFTNTPMSRHRPPAAH